MRRVRLYPSCCAHLSVFRATNTQDITYTSYIVPLVYVRSCSVIKVTVVRGLYSVPLLISIHPLWGQLTLKYTTRLLDVATVCFLRVNALFIRHKKYPSRSFAILPGFIS